DADSSAPAPSTWSGSQRPRTSRSRPSGDSLIAPLTLRTLVIPPPHRFGVSCATLEVRNSRQMRRGGGRELGDAGFAGSDGLAVATRVAGNPAHGHVD